MSDYHIGEKSIDNRYADVYIHLPIPATENTAGQALAGETITYQDAVKGTLRKDEFGNTIFTRIPNMIIAAELAQFQNGGLFEKHVHFRFDSLELTDGERRQQIENGNTNEVGVIQLLSDIVTPGTDLYNEVIEALEWWGYHRDV